MRPIKGNSQAALKRLELQEKIFKRKKDAHENSELEEFMKQIRDANTIEMVHGNAEAWAEKVVEEIGVNTSATQAKSKPESKSKPKKSKSKNKAVAVTTPMTVKEVKQEEEVISEEAKTVVENALKVEADVKTIKSKGSVKSINVTYCIGNHLGGGLYEGTKSSRIFSVQRSFIKARSSQLDNIDELIDIGSNSRFIVTIDDLIDGPRLVPVLVAEHVMLITSFFKVESDLFLSENSLDYGSRQRWWTRISESFRSIFGNIVHGIIYLDSLGHVCGNVTNHIYVSAKGEGKILPLMDKRRSKSYDIKNLIKKMIEIITLPFPETEVQEAYQLPDELTHLLAFATTDKLRDIPLYWLVNHPYFWSSKERINFLKELRDLIKEDVFSEKTINNILSKDSSFVGPAPSRIIDWRKMFDDSVCNGLFKHIYDRPNVKEDVKEYLSSHPCEIIRYVPNCYNHGNDFYYRNSTKSRVSYSDIEIEAQLRSFFPLLYVDLYVALYQITSMSISSSKTRICKAFENWSISYFAPTRHAASIDKTKQIFGLVQARTVMEPVSSSLSKSSLSTSLRALSRCGKELGNKQIIIRVKKEVMNQSQNLYFGQDEIDQLLKKDQLGATHINTYIRLLYADCVAEGLTKTFGFVCPSCISSPILSKDVELIRMDRLKRSEHILTAFRDDASDGKLYLAPYNIMHHWVLCLINPFACTVDYLDPLSDQGIGQDIRNVVDMALRLYWNQPEKTVTWNQIQCPQQNNMVDCGYYVLRFMREIIDHQLIRIPDMYFDDCVVPTFDKGQIDEIREELAYYVLSEFILNQNVGDLTN